MLPLRTLAVAIALAPSAAHAAEVVWLDPPSDEDALRVAVQARAQRGPLTPAGFRAVPVESGPADDIALEVLETTLDQVRVHEKVLDGEVLILNGLDAPLQQVGLLRGKRDRDIVVRSLLYQGFAADRYWGDTLDDAPDAQRWRIRVEDRFVEKPWLDAFALDPLRKATPQDITEGPQRAAYEDLRRVLARTTRASLVAEDLPEGAKLVLDGEVQELDESLMIEVLPGRHWLHVELDGEIIGRQVERLEPTQRLEIALPVPESDWQGLVKTLHGARSVVPERVGAVIERMGGEVWFAEGAGETLRVWSVKPDGVERISLVSSEAPPQSRALGNVSLAGWVGPTWLNSADFRAQDPDAVPDGAGVVNAVAPHLSVEMAWDKEWLRYGLGLDLSVPLGTHHVALSGPEGKLRARPYPHVLVGHPLVQASFGLFFPYHLMGGVQTSVPIPGYEPLEARGFVRIGGSPARTRADGTSWTGQPVVQIGIGVGARIRP